MRNWKSQTVRYLFKLHSKNQKLKQHDLKSPFNNCTRECGTSGPAFAWITVPEACGPNESAQARARRFSEHDLAFY